MSDTNLASAVLLLNLRLKQLGSNHANPLSPGEWSRFAQWLYSKNRTPDVLLREDTRTVLHGFEDRAISVERVDALLNRGVALGVALERWQRAGIWVLTRSDNEYPKQLKRLLHWEAPAFLFGIGNKNLLNIKGIAVVGSRKAAVEECRYASNVGRIVSEQGFNLVSGGARGIDSNAMTGALASEGTVTAVLANGLLKASTSRKFRQHLMEQNLVLVSHITPEAGFDPGNAMARNRYIYCLSKAAIVVCSDIGKGGTWNGACENLRFNWVPLWVKRSSDFGSGNGKLIEQGARALPDESDELTCQIALMSESGVDSRDRVPEADVAKTDQHISQYANRDTSGDESANPNIEKDSLEFPTPTEGDVKLPAESSTIRHDLYKCFLDNLESITSESAISADQLKRSLSLERTQCQEWLKRATEEGKVKKYTRPVRYQFVHDRLVQRDIFDN